jgi:proline dehydrogenase
MMRLADPLRQRRASAYGAGPTLDAALSLCRRLQREGLACTVGYVAMPGESARSVADAHVEAFERLAAAGLDGHVSIKLSTLDFDLSLFSELDAVAARSGCGLHIDALGPETVDATWRVIESAPRAGRIGTTLPGAWPRSVDDAARVARLGLRVRVVKGQWTGSTDPVEGFRRVVARLRGHRDGVGVATHDVALLESSLQCLSAAGTSCAAELFLGLPFRRPAATARRLGVPIRVYVPYGRAAAPYGVADVRANPAVAWWLIQDLLLGKDKTWRSLRPSRVRRA